MPDPVLTIHQLTATTAQPVDPADTHGAPSVTGLQFDGEGGYTRQDTGWCLHELSGLCIEGMAEGEQFQIQIATLDESGDNVTWSNVLLDQAATSGRQFASASRMLRTKRREKIRWRLLYFGDRTDVDITRATWTITAHPADGPEPRHKGDR